MPQVMLNRIARPFILLLVLSAMGAAEHRPPNGYGPGSSMFDTGTVAKGLVTALEVPSGPQLLGSGWVLHYVIHNRGSSTIQWNQGGDSHAPRPIRVWLEAIGPDGDWATDPLAHTRVSSMGGFMGGSELEPQGTSYMTVNPRLFVRFDRPGRWTLRMYHDLGMGPMTGDEDPRWATATIDLVMPDHEQAQRILTEHEERLLDTYPPIGGERNPPRADFKAMAFPIFLPLLEVRARQGWSAAIEAIAAMPTMEATDLLMKLAQIEQILVPSGKADARPYPLPQVAALDALTERLPPHSADPRRATGDPHLMRAMDHERRQRSSAIALRVSQHSDYQVRDAAAALLARTAPDPALLLDLIGREVMQADNRQALIPLLAAFRARSAVIPDPHLSAAAATVWLNNPPRPRERTDGWEETVAGLLSHPAPGVRQSALCAVPWESSRHWTPDLERLLRDPDVGVSTEALRCTERYQDQILIPAMRHAMCRATYLHNAVETIRKLGGRVAELEAWTDYMESSQKPHSAWLSLVSFIPALTGLSYQDAWSNGQEPDAATRRQIAARWRAFVAAHRDQLARAPLEPDDTWPVDLLPAGCFIYLQGGGQWPAKQR